MSEAFHIIRRFFSRPEAEFAQQLLDSVGISSQIQGDDACGWQPFYGFDSGGIRLVVSQDQAEEARSVLEDLDDEEQQA